ncbi:ImuA family protein [Albidovulum sp.]
MTTRPLDRIIPREARRPRRPLAFLGRLPLARARIHEFCGPARHALALMAAQATEGPVLWIRPAWLAEDLLPQGILPFTDPGRLLLVRPRRAEDLLWCLEETLRSGAAALAVAELAEPPALTPVRRLLLAAETGAGTGPATPTGLILTPAAGGAAGIDSRWHATPLPGGGSRLWRLDILRSRDGTGGSWQIAARSNGRGATLTRLSRDPGNPP